MQSAKLILRRLGLHGGIGVAVAAAAVQLASPAMGQAAPEKAPYLIGINDALSGTVAFSATTLRAGFLTYMTYLNKEKGGINGHQIVFKEMDNHGDGGTALANYRQLVRDYHVMATIGYSSSVAWAGAGAASDSLKVVQAATGGVDKWTDEDHPYLFKLQQPQATMANVVANFAKKLIAQQNMSGPHRVAVIAVNTASGPFYDKALRALAASNGWEVVGTQFADLAASDCSAQAADLLARNPTIFLTGLSSAGEDIVCFNALKSRGWTGPVVNSAYSGGDEVMQRLASPNWYGERVSTSFLDSSIPAVVEMRDRAERYGFTEFYRNYFVDGYLAGILFARAIDKCGDDCNAATFRDALTNLGKVDSGGLAGPNFGFTRQPDGRVAQPDGQFFAWDPSRKQAVKQTDWICGASDRC